MSFKSNFAGILPGMVDHAIIEFEDQRKIADEINTVRQKVKSDVELKMSTLGMDPVKLQAQVTARVEETLAKTMSDLLGTGGRKAEKGVKFLRYEVLFNPNRITLSGRGAAKVPMNDFSKGISVTYQERQANLELRIPLIVDRTLASQVSMGVSIPGVNASLVQGVKDKVESVANWFTSGTSGDIGSIQRDVEVFVAMLRNEHTRLVSFYWGNMKYTGVLTSVSSTYTMFDPQGHPTRANIDLLIMLADAKNPILIYNGKEKGPWMEYYRKAFEGKTSLSARSNTQYFENILNL